MIRPEDDNALTLSEQTWTTLIASLGDDAAFTMTKRRKKAKPDKWGRVTLLIPEGCVDEVIDTFNELFAEAVGDE